MQLNIADIVMEFHVTIAHRLRVLFSSDPLTINAELLQAIAKDITPNPMKIL